MIIIYRIEGALEKMSKRSAGRGLGPPRSVKRGFGGERSEGAEPPLTHN